VDGISVVAECGRGFLVVRVYKSFLYWRESGWVGFCRGVGRGYAGVALKRSGVQEERYVSVVGQVSGCLIDI
jgi:hypothetical protein